MLQIVEMAKMPLTLKFNACKMNLTPVIFWDVDMETMDYDKHSAFIIERVATLGKVSDWRAIQSYYGRTKIISVLLEARN